MDPDGFTARRQTTNAAGEFLFLGIPPGQYSLEARMEGYPDYKVDSIRVGFGSASTVTIAMEPRIPGSPVTSLSAWQGTAYDPWVSDSGSRFERIRLDSLPSARNVWALLDTKDSFIVSWCLCVFVVCVL